MKEQYANRDGTAHQLEVLRGQLEQELKDKVDEMEDDNKYKLQQEALKLEMDREKVVEDYEDTLKLELDQHLDGIRHAHENSLANQQREFEVQKIKQDQYYDNELERQKEDIKYKFQKKFDELESEKTKKLNEIENSLKDLSLTSENPDLSYKLQESIKEQKKLERQIEQLNASITEQRNKSKELSQEIIDINKQKMEKERLNQNDKGARIAKLRQQIDKVDSDIIRAELDYQKLKDGSSRVGDNYDSENDDINKSSISKFRTSNQDFNNVSLEQLAKDVSEIKSLIDDTGIGNKKLKDFIVDASAFRRNKDDSKPLSYEDDNLYLLRDQLRKEKTAMKRRQKQIETQKKKWKEEKQHLEDNPQMQTPARQQEVDRMRKELEDSIDEINEDISEYKRKEKTLKRREQHEGDENDESMFDRDVSQVHLYQSHLYSVMKIIVSE